MKYSILLTCDSDSPETVLDLIGVVRTTASYMVDNVEITNAVSEG